MTPSLEGPRVNGLSRCQPLLSASPSRGWSVETRPQRRRLANTHCDKDDPANKRTSSPDVINAARPQRGRGHVSDPASTQDRGFLVFPLFERFSSVAKQHGLLGKWTREDVV
ncbi:Hypothetical protein SMAX5B_013714 [Scophthalmus maximus]|uniref:Uncharacterized protein n=1 Tax=Scophthalmus maximus TaxID=52904 RepID=A0A2U9AZX8_SCOMX|nr:Hypothetical protein SMAX5B_013714 [Scophthalmus maximus]